MIKYRCNRSINHRSARGKPSAAAEVWVWGLTYPPTPTPTPSTANVLIDAVGYVCSESVKRDDYLPRTVGDELTRCLAVTLKRNQLIKFDVFVISSQTLSNSIKQINCIHYNQNLPGWSPPGRKIHDACQRLCSRHNDLQHYVLILIYIYIYIYIIHIPTTVGSRSTKTALGTCFPAPVSLKNVLKESSPPPTVLSLGICPSGWMPCSRQ